MIKNSIFAALLATTALTAAVASPAFAAQPAKACKTITPVKLGVSIYVGWQPWYWANQTGLVKSIGAKHCLDISVTEFQNYGDSLAAFSAKQVDALVITNMDTLMTRASTGLDSTVVIVGDFSNGNDAILSKDPRVNSIKDLAGQTIHRAAGTVTDYLIERAMEQNGMKTGDIQLENLDESGHLSAFNGGDVKNLGTWNPWTMQLQQMSTPRYPVKTLFTSAKIPREIQDLLVVDTKVLNGNKEIGAAFAEVWYTAMDVMNQKDAAGKPTKKAGDALEIMADTAAHATLDQYLGQLKTTHMYYTPAEAVAFTESDDMVEITKSVRDFTYARGLMGEGNTNPEAIGISFPNGKVLGNPKNILVRFDTSFMKTAKH